CSSKSLPSAVCALAFFDSTRRLVSEMSDGSRWTCRGKRSIKRASSIFLSLRPEPGNEGHPNGHCISKFVFGTWLPRAAEAKSRQLAKAFPYCLVRLIEDACDDLFCVGRNNFQEFAEFDSHRRSRNPNENCAAWSDPLVTALRHQELL